MEPKHNYSTEHETPTAYSRAASARIHTWINTVLLLLAITIFSFVACNGGKKGEEKTETALKSRHHHHRPPHGDGYGPQFVTIDSANKMISSYLVSINAASNDTDLYCLMYDADSLRAYLANMSIKKVKVMFAHTLSYINDGNKNQPCGYEDGALTLIIAGYDASGNYVYYPPQSSTLKEVIDHAMPCPTNCPQNGTAASNLLQ